MVLSNHDQLYLLYSCLGCGAILGLYYDMFCVIRVFRRTSPVTLFIQDIIVCLSSSVGFFLFTLAVNGGEAHLPMIAAAAVGFAVSRTTIGRFILRNTVRLRYVFAAIERCLTATSTKLGEIWRNLSKKVAVFFKKGLHYLYKMVYNRKRK